MDLEKIVASNVRRVRQQLNLTQEELAERADLSTRYVGSIERGKVAITVKVLGQIAAALQVNPAELLQRGSNCGIVE